MHAEYYCPVLIAFHEDGTFDKEKQHILYDRLLEAGIDGVVVFGSSREFYALTYDECCTVGQDAIAYISGRRPVYVSTGRMSATETIALSSEMIDAGATGVIVVGPYYISASNAGTKAFYDEVALGVDGSIIIYNYPERTGYDVAPVLAQLIEQHPNIVGVKDTVESATHTQRIIAELHEAHPDFRIYSGFDNNLVPVVFAGGTGVIAALSNMVPDLCSHWIQALRKENFDDVARMHKQICALMSVYSMTTPFMSGMKYLIGLQEQV